MQETDSLAQRLSLILDPLQDKIKDWHCRVVPSAFNSTDPYLRALPLAREWHWPSAEEHLKRFGPETVILQLPSFWQVEPFAHLAARAAEAPVCIIEPQNYPLDKAAIRLASANAVWAESTEVAAIADYLHKEQIALPPYWMLVHAGNAAHWDTPALLKNRNTSVAAEVHLAPGVPLLVQCAAIVDAQNGLYHQSGLFTWSADLSSPSITTTSSFLFTLTNFALPFTLTGKGICTCGKKLLARAT